MHKTRIIKQQSKFHINEKEGESDSNQIKYKHSEDLSDEENTRKQSTQPRANVPHRAPNGMGQSHPMGQLDFLKYPMGWDGTKS